MTLAQHKIQLAQKVLQTEDKAILKTIELLFDVEQHNVTLTKTDKQELDKRIDTIESGQSELYTFDTVKKMVRKNYKASKK